MWNSSKACHYSHAWSVWVCCPALSLEAFQPWLLRGELLCLMWSGRSEGVKMARGGQGCAWNVVTSPWQWILRDSYWGIVLSPLETLNYRNFLGLHYKLPLWVSDMFMVQVNVWLTVVWKYLWVAGQDYSLPPPLGTLHSTMVSKVSISGWKQRSS